MVSLKGNLKEFSISEVVQFLSLSYKTGILKIKSEAEGYIYFKNGQGYYATSTRYKKPLGQRLVEAGLISKEDLAKALETQKGKASNRRLGRIFVEMGLIDVKALESFVKEQIWDAFLDILSWEEGDFEFEVGGVPIEEDIGITFETWDKVKTSIPSFENVIKSEHWAKIKEAIPSLDIVFALNKERAADMAGVSLAPDEWGLVCLIDGKKTGEELMRECGKDHFQAGHTLYKLLRAGLITEVGEGKAFLKVAESEKKTGPDEKQLEPVKPVGNKLGFTTETLKEKEPTSIKTLRDEEEIRGKKEEPKEEKVKETTTSNVPPDCIDVRSLGNLEVWIGKEKRLADLFIIKRGEKTSNVLRYPDGRYQFVHDRFSPEEKKVILEKIALVKK